MLLLFYLAQKLFRMSMKYLCVVIKHAVIFFAVYINVNRGIKSQNNCLVLQSDVKLYVTGHWLPL
jgi:hypothetical protein